MSIIQTLIGAIVSSGSGGPPPTPNAYASYTGSPEEGGNTDIIIYVENWNGSRIWWSVVGKGDPAAVPNTDITGTLSGFWDPGVTSYASTVVSNISFTADETSEGTEYWGVNLGTTEGGSDIWNGNTWSVGEPLFYNQWTIEWFQKSNPSQPSQFPRVFGINTYPSQPIGFSMEGIYYGWIAGTAFGTNASVTHNSWQHWAMVCDGTNVSIFRNGSRVANAPRSNYGQILNTTSDFYVGIDSSPANGYKGLITNFRVVKGLAMYAPSETTITVPTAPLVNNPFTELLLKAVDSGNAYADSSGRARTAASTGSNAFSSDTPFTAPTPAGPYTQSTGQTGGGGAFGGILDFAGGNYNADLLNVKTGWTVTNGVTSGQVTEDAYEIIPGTIRIGVNFEPTPGQATWTFTQYQIGGSIEFYTSSYGMLLYNAGSEWALDIP